MDVSGVDSCAPLDRCVVYYGRNMFTGSLDKRMNFSLAALIFSVVSGAVGQLLMKAGLQGMQAESVLSMVGGIWSSPKSALMLFCGLACYIAAVPAWIIALKRFELSFAYPLIGLGYLIVYVGAFYWPGMEESITWQKTVGMALIIAGVSLAAQTRKPLGWFRYAKNEKT